MHIVQKYMYTCASKYRVYSAGVEGARFTGQKGGKIAACVTQPVPHKSLSIRMYKNKEIKNIDDVTSDVQ